MAIYALDGEAPELPGDGLYWVADTAAVIGRVRLHSDVSIWWGSVLRGDNEWIDIGAGSQIQDNATLHTDPGFPLSIGKDCVIGHNVILHGCSVGDASLIGMGAIILNGAKIGANSLVGAGALITEGKEFPDNSVIVGAPAKLVREADDKTRAMTARAAGVYVRRWKQYAAGLMRLLDYELPEALIAQHPAARREDSRLLVVERSTGALTDARFSDLGRWLEPGDVLVVNETRVRPARLMVRRPTGGRVELLFVRPESGGGERWRVLARPARHAAVGARLATADAALAVEVVSEGEQGERVVRVVSGSLDAVLREQGEIPLPPYIHRAPTAEDSERYQTVYARLDGAVAAPTAGLHFSVQLLDSLAAAGIHRVPVTLHVGPGTFRPIIAEDPRDHEMEEEWFEVSESAAAAMRAARERGGRIVAVGTTTVRALESAGRGGPIGAGDGVADVFLYPGGAPIAHVDALLTNFHLPRSSLLMLVCAFAGREAVLRAYHEAVAAGYRFYSYGDAMLIV